MRFILALVSTTLLMAGCAEGQMPDFNANLFVAPSPAAAPPPSEREAVCDFSRKVLGMPILVDPNARSVAYDKLGRAQANELFRPLARANNSFRCVCGTPEEKLKAKC